MKKHLFPLLSLLIPLLLLLGACTPSAEPTSAVQPTATEEMVEPTEVPADTTIEIVDGLGRTVTLSGPAQRIVSIAPSNTEILYAIGAGSQVVGRDAFSDYPAEVLNVADVGGGFGELNMELIVSLEPDLILSADIISAENIQALTDLGLPVFALANPLTYDDLLGNLKLVGRLTGHETDAEALAAQLGERIQAVQTTVAVSSFQPIVFYQLDSTDPAAPYTAGPGNFIDTLITSAGGINATGDMDSPWVQISLEELITRNPDVIIVGDFTWGGVTAADVLARSGWEGIKAVVNGQVFEFDDNLVSRPGPRMVDGLEQMAKLLHPEWFK
jgi:iron complex transport system substrate-binding protein